VLKKLSFQDLTPLVMLCGMHTDIPRAAVASQALTDTTDLRLATFARPGDADLRVGIVCNDGRVVDVAAEAARRGVALSFDGTRMLSVIASGAEGLALLRAVAAEASPDSLSLADVHLASPIPVPERNIYCVGWNYVEHFQEGNVAKQVTQAYPEHPVFFTKGQHAMNGPFSPIPFDPNVSTRIDWETELAVVIGRRGRNIGEDEALDHVFGFTILNDTTARDIQQARHGGQWFKGKSLDGHAPMGPWIVTRGALDFGNLPIETRINGVVRQQATTAQMYFKIPRIIAELSLGLTLEPGDIIATGTPPGVGFAMKPPVFMEPGDVMESEIGGIGTMRNVITAV